MINLLDNFFAGIEDGDENWKKISSYIYYKFVLKFKLKIRECIVIILFYYNLYILFIYYIKIVWTFNL